MWCSVESAQHSCVGCCFMELGEYWIKQGQFVARPQHVSGAALPDKTLLFQHELVHIACSAQGIVCKWVMFSANWTSLYFMKEFLAVFVGPFTLEFFNAGWFSEHFETAADAKNRIDQLISKSDVRFSARTFTRPFDPTERAIPKSLKEMWSAGALDESRSVHCSINIDREISQVHHIGPNSALAKIWGISPVSYPSLSGHSYDKVVSRTYYDVVRTGRPHYDHVLAAMVNPTGEIKWYGYHRLVFPRKVAPGSLPQVSVACEVAQVDIPLL
jgi:hypothetical protein